MKDINIKVGDTVLVPFEVLDIHDSGDYPYFLGYGTSRIHASAEMLERFQQAAGRVKDSGKTYEDGLVEAWEMAKKMFLYPHEGGYSSEELEEIFGRTEHLWELSPQETAEEIAKWAKKKKIKVGDVLRDNNMREAVVSCVSPLGNIFVIYSDGSCGTCDDDIEDYTETGRTINIAGLLAQIGGAE